MKVCFDHEKLDVYHEAIDFWGWVGDFLPAISAKAASIYSAESDYDHEHEHE
jgi:hypothetical protein